MACANWTYHDCGCLHTEVRDGRVWYWPHRASCPENPANQTVYFSNVSDPESWDLTTDPTPNIGDATGET